MSTQAGDGGMAQPLCSAGRSLSRLDSGGRQQQLQQQSSGSYTPGLVRTGSSTARPGHPPTSRVMHSQLPHAWADAEPHQPLHQQAKPPQATPHAHMVSPGPPAHSSRHYMPPSEPEPPAPRSPNARPHTAGPALHPYSPAPAAGRSQSPGEVECHTTGHTTTSQRAAAQAGLTHAPAHVAPAAAPGSGATASRMLVRPASMRHPRAGAVADGPRQAATSTSGPTSPRAEEHPWQQGPGHGFAAAKHLGPGGGSSDAAAAGTSAARLMPQKAAATPTSDPASRIPASAMAAAAAALGSSSTIASPPQSASAAGARHYRMPAGVASTPLYIPGQQAPTSPTTATTPTRVPMSPAAASHSLPTLLGSPVLLDLHRPPAPHTPPSTVHVHSGPSHTHLHPGGPAAAAPADGAPAGGRRPMASPRQNAAPASLRRSGSWFRVREAVPALDAFHDPLLRDAPHPNALQEDPLQRQHSGSPHVHFGPGYVLAVGGGSSSSGPNSPVSSCGGIAAMQRQISANSRNSSWLRRADAMPPIEMLPVPHPPTNTAGSADVGEAPGSPFAGPTAQQWLRQSSSRLSNGASRVPGPQHSHGGGASAAGAMAEARMPVNWASARSSPQTGAPPAAAGPSSRATAIPSPPATSSHLDEDAQLALLGSSRMMSSVLTLTDTLARDANTQHMLLFEEDPAAHITTIPEYSVTSQLSHAILGNSRIGSTVFSPPLPQAGVRAPGGAGRGGIKKAPMRQGSASWAGRHSMPDLLQLGQHVGTSVVVLPDGRYVDLLAASHAAPGEEDGSEEGGEEDEVITALNTSSSPMGPAAGRASHGALHSAGTASQRSARGGLRLVNSTLSSRGLDARPASGGRPRSGVTVVSGTSESGMRSACTTPASHRGGHMTAQSFKALQALGGPPSRQQSAPIGSQRNSRTGEHSSDGGGPGAAAAVQGPAAGEAAAAAAGQEADRSSLLSKGMRLLRRAFSISSKSPAVGGGGGATSPGPKALSPSPAMPRHHRRTASAVAATEDLAAVATGRRAPSSSGGPSPRAIAAAGGGGASLDACRISSKQLHVSQKSFAKHSAVLGWVQPESSAEEERSEVDDGDGLARLAGRNARASASGHGRQAYGDSGRRSSLFGGAKPGKAWSLRDLTAVQLTCDAVAAPEAAAGGYAERFPLHGSRGRGAGGLSAGQSAAFALHEDPGEGASGAEPERDSDARQSRRGSMDSAAGGGAAGSGVLATPTGSQRSSRGSFIAGKLGMGAQRSPGSAASVFRRKSVVHPSPGTPAGGVPAALSDGPVD